MLFPLYTDASLLVGMMPPEHDPGTSDMTKRPILLSPNVIHIIWSLWKDGDPDEDAILRRVLTNVQGHTTQSETALNAPLEENIHGQKEENEYETHMRPSHEEEGKMAEKWNTPQLGKVRWVDDIRAALLGLGGEADLATIYQVVEQVRRDGGRTIPKSLDATIRQSIEAHCPTSDNFRENNEKYFEHVARGRYRLI